MTKDEREQYLRGISASAPEATIGVPENEALLRMVYDDWLANPADPLGPINLLMQDDFQYHGLIKDAIERRVGTEPMHFIHQWGDSQKGTRTIVRIVSEGVRLARENLATKITGK